MDAVHVPYFAAITVLITFCIRHCSWRNRVLAASLCVLVWAGAVELIQPLTGRTRDIIDFRNGAIGVSIAAAALLSRRGRPILVLAGTIALGYALAPTWREYKAERERTLGFPMLGDFEKAFELKLWITPDSGEPPPHFTQIARSAAYASHGRYSLEVTITGGGRGANGLPGVRFLADGQNWSAYRMLAFDVFNPGSPFELGLRLDDANSTDRTNRYNGSVQVVAGWNHFSLSLARIAGEPEKGLDLRKIRRLLFYTDGESDRKFYLDNVRLE